MSKGDGFMNYIDEILKYQPINEQEETDKDIILKYIKDYPHNILLRDNQVAHMTSSAIILNKDHTKMLMIHHNIYKTWTWVGGHADGESDMLKLAIKEAQEETGIKDFDVATDIATIDILLVDSHIKKGKYVAPHLHLNVAYVLEAHEDHDLVLNEDETSGLKWVPIEEIDTYSGELSIIYVYHKMLKKVGIFRDIS